MAEKGKKDRPRLALVAPAVSSHTIDALEDMLEAARAGEIIGLAVVAKMKRKRFFVDVFGEARRDPVCMRGALRSLDEDLSARVAAMHNTDSTMDPVLEGWD